MNMKLNGCSVQDMFGFFHMYQDVQMCVGINFWCNTGIYMDFEVLMLPFRLSPTVLVSYSTCTEYMCVSVKQDSWFVSECISERYYSTEAIKG